MTDAEVFTLLRNYLSDARDLRFDRVEDWDGDLRIVDMGIRAQMKDGAELYQQLREIIQSVAPGEIVKLRDALKLNYVFFRADSESHAFLFIGPFYTSSSDQPGSAPGREKDTLRLLLRNVPHSISAREVLVMARHYQQYFQNIRDFRVRELFLDETVQPTGYLLRSDDIAEHAKAVEEVYVHEHLLFTAVAQGDYEKALTEGKFFMKSDVRTYIADPMRSTRSLLYSANTAFRLVAAGVGIHPVAQDEISQRFALRLDNCVTREQLESTYMEMISDYCSLCRRQAMPSCTSTMQKMLDYIQLNLGGELTPETVAAGVGFSAVYVSRRFKEELGTTFTSYVSAQRVKAAQRLLAETSMPIREIADYVGIPDWNYFAKVFKKETGQTPSAWRKQAGQAPS